MSEEWDNDPSPTESGTRPTASYAYHSRNHERKLDINRLKARELARELLNLRRGRIPVTVRVEGRNGEDGFEFEQDLDMDMTVADMEDMYRMQINAQLPRAPLRNHPLWDLKIFLLTSNMFTIREIARSLLKPVEILRYSIPLTKMRDMRIRRFIRRGDTLIVRIFDHRGVQKVWDENLKSWRSGGYTFTDERDPWGLKMGPREWAEKREQEEVDWQTYWIKLHRGVRLA
ncbi:hypothetical protein ABW21_db0204049 [Orbilia brochopaga]|nr:hypothetical protein ABW21_db0204049 [Drechslerella brochopaga]